MRNHSLETLAVHGIEPRPEAGNPLSPDLSISTSFHLAPDTGFSASSLGENPPPVYTRWGNPTVGCLERKLAALEGAGSAVCFSSGMAAVTSLILSQLKSGDHLVASNVCYAGVAEWMHELADYGIDVSFVDVSDVEAVSQAITSRTKLVFFETPANPILRLADIRAISACARAAGAKVAVDSTFATPVSTQALLLGADFVVHSLTKYACGHGDTLGGVVAGSTRDVDVIRSGSLIHMGGVLHPFGAWLIDRSLQTLTLRMKQHEENAFAVARFLEGHPAVEQVFYPGLPSHPQHELARRQMSNFSGMVTFRARCADRVKHRLVERSQVVSYAVSLGKTKSLIVLVDTDELQSKSFRLPPAELAKYKSWAGDAIFRLSVGLESADDIIADLDDALA